MSLARRIESAWWRVPPSVLSTLLLPLSWLYGAVIARQRVEPQRLDVPVVVVGNLIVGGAGKTPTTRAVVELLRRAGWQPGIVSRGYGRRGDAVLALEPHHGAAEAGDEPLMLMRATGAPVVVGRDRVAAATLLRRLHPQVDVIVSDDGLQHRRLHRDVAVIVFDARGAGNGRLLPAGPLREPMGREPPPGSLVLYNADRPSTPWPGHRAHRSLGGAVELRDWAAGTAATPQALKSLRGRPLLAAAGMADPGRFFRMLREAGLDVRELPLPDHHDYATLPWPPDTPEVVVTEKDAVKLDPQRLGSTRVWVAALDFAPEPAFAAELLRRLRRTARG